MSCLSVLGSEEEPGREGRDEVSYRAACNRVMTTTMIITCSLLHSTLYWTLYSSLINQDFLFQRVKKANSNRHGQKKEMNGSCN